jgi:hypothetical protein
MVGWLNNNQIARGQGRSRQFGFFKPKPVKPKPKPSRPKKSRLDRLKKADHIGLKKPTISA